MPRSTRALNTVEKKKKNNNDLFIIQNNIIYTRDEDVKRHTIKSDDARAYTARTIVYDYDGGGSIVV